MPRSSKESRSRSDRPKAPISEESNVYDLDEVAKLSDQRTLSLFKDYNRDVLFGNYVAVCNAIYQNMIRFYPHDIRNITMQHVLDYFKTILYTQGHKNRGCEWLPDIVKEPNGYFFLLYIPHTETIEEFKKKIQIIGVVSPDESFWASPPHSIYINVRCTFTKIKSDIIAMTSGRLLWCYIILLSSIWHKKYDKTGQLVIYNLALPQAKAYHKAMGMLDFHDLNKELRQQILDNPSHFPAIEEDTVDPSYHPDHNEASNLFFEVKKNVIDQISQPESCIINDGVGISSHIPIYLNQSQIMEYLYNIFIAGGFPLSKTGFEPAGKSRRSKRKPKKRSRYSRRRRPSKISKCTRRNRPRRRRRRPSRISSR